MGGGGELPRRQRGGADLPSNSQIYNSPLNHSEPFLLQDCTSFYSSFSEVQPYGIPGVASEAAYDTWWNSYANEIMFQHDMVDPSNLRGGFPTIDTAYSAGPTVSRCRTGT